MKISCRRLVLVMVSTALTCAVVAAVASDYMFDGSAGQTATSKGIV